MLKIPTVNTLFSKWVNDPDLSINEKNLKKI